MVFSEPYWKSCVEFGFSSGEGGWRERSIVLHASVTDCLASVPFSLMHSHSGVILEVSYRFHMWEMVSRVICKLLGADNLYLCDTQMVNRSQIIRPYLALQSCSKEVLQFVIWHRSFVFEDKKSKILLGTWKPLGMPKVTCWILAILCKQLALALWFLIYFPSGPFGGSAICLPLV